MKVSYADMNTPYKLILRNILYLSYYGAHWKRNHYINFFIRSIGRRNWLSNKMEFSFCIFGSFPFFLICIPWTLFIDVFFLALFYANDYLYIYMGAYLNKTFIEKYLWFYICPPRSNRRYTVCDNLLWLTSKVKSKKYEIYTNFIWLP